MHLRSASILAFTVFLFAGCKTSKFLKKEKAAAEIEGQVFVVTKGRENVKMGLVPIHVLSEDQFNQIFSKVADSIVEVRVENVDNKANNKALLDFGGELASMKRSNLRLEIPLLDELSDEALKKAGEYEINGEYLAARSAISTLLPPPVTKTDADGRFKISIDSKVWIVAQGERSVGKESESYLWIESVDKPNEDGGSPVLISNDSGYDNIEALYTFLSFKVGDVEPLPNLMGGEAYQQVVQWIKVAKAKAENAIKAAKDESDKAANEAKTMSEGNEEQDVIAKLKIAEVKSTAWRLDFNALLGRGFQFNFMLREPGESTVTNQLAKKEEVREGDVFFRDGVGKGRFKLLKVQSRKMNTSTGERNVLFAFVEDQLRNKKGEVYELQYGISSYSQRLRNTQYDHTVTFYLDDSGATGRKVDVIENGTLTLPSGGTRKSYKLIKVNLDSNNKPESVILKGASGLFTISVED